MVAVLLIYFPAFATVTIAARIVRPFKVASLLYNAQNVTCRYVRWTQPSQWPDACLIQRHVSIANDFTPTYEPRPASTSASVRFFNHRLTSAGFISYLPWRGPAVDDRVQFADELSSANFMLFRYPAGKMMAQVIFHRFRIAVHFTFLRAFWVLTELSSRIRNFHCADPTCSAETSGSTSPQRHRAAP